MSLVFDEIIPHEYVSVCTAIESHQHVNLSTNASKKLVAQWHPFPLRKWSPAGWSCLPLNCLEGKKMKKCIAVNDNPPEWSI